VSKDVSIELLCVESSSTKSPPSLAVPTRSLRTSMMLPGSAIQPASALPEKSTWLPAVTPDSATDFLGLEGEAMFSDMGVVSL